MDPKLKRKDALKFFDDFISKQDKTFVSQDNFFNIQRPDVSQDPFVQEKRMNDIGSMVANYATQVHPYASGMGLTKGFEGYDENIYTDTKGYDTGGYGTKIDPNVDYSNWTEADWDRQFQKDYNIKRG